MIEPPNWEALSFFNILSAKQREDGIAKSEKAANGGRHWKRDKCAKTDPQEV